MNLKRGMQMTLDGQDVFYNGTAAGSFVKVLVPGSGVRSEEKTVSVFDLRFPCPDWAADWTLDEVAECLDGIDNAFRDKLWEMMAEVPKDARTPQGGDGTDGTVETPDGRQGSFGDKLDAHWDALDFWNQALLLDAYVKTTGQDD